jgi:NAD(P)-dependent dehydrogenase (short-subunit alcohol dehydrogenase family)
MTQHNDSRKTKKKLNRRVFVATATAVTALAANGAFKAFAQTSPHTVLITGSNRGIGLEFARAYAAKGWTVIATCRKPAQATDLQALAADHANVTIEALDVTDLAAIDALAAKYKDTPIDILLNNAGILGGIEEQKFGQLDYDLFYKVMAVNYTGPVKMAEAFLDNVAASDLKKIITVTSSQGSIKGARGRGNYFYKASKSAVNMAMRTLSKEVAKRDVIVGLIDPGAVDTDLMKPIHLPFPLTPPAKAVGELITVIDGFTKETSGDAIQHSGRPLPW